MTDHPVLAEQKYPGEWIPPTYVTRDSESPFGPDGIGGFLRRRKWTILCGFLATAASVGGVIYLLPARYESSVSFLVEAPNSQRSSEALEPLERLGQSRNAETEVELIQSRRVVEPVVDELDLHVELKSDHDDVRPGDVFTSFSAGPDALPGRYRLARSGNNYDVTEEESGRKVATGSPGSPVVFAGISATIPASNAFTDLSLNIIPFEQAVDSVRKRINAVAIQKQADVVRLTCRDKTARGAFSLCSEIQRQYLSLRAELQRGEAVAAANFLREQAERARLTLSAAEDDLQRYQEEHRALDLGEKARQDVIQYGDLQARLGQLTGERSTLSAILGDVEGGEGNVDKYRRLASFPPFLQNKDNVVTELVASLVVLENKRSELGSHRTEANPELAAVIARISEIEGQILSSAQSYLQSLSAQVASAKQTLADQSVELAAVPSQEVETARLQRRVGMLEEAYRFLQTRRQDAEVAEAVALPSVRTIDRPSLPYDATVAKVPLGVVIGTILGLFVGLLAALWREGTDRKIRHWKQVRAWGVPVLAMVPRVPKSLVVQSTRDVQRRLQRVVHDQSVVAGEAFRGLAFELESIANRVAEKGVRSIAITSAGYPEGKTFCAVNLAVQLVLMGKKPLLIDADVRAQGVTRRLGIPSDSPGFAEVVRSEGDLRPAIVKIALGEQVLSVVPSGSESNTGQRLFTATVQRVIGESEAQYDVVIVDTPPINLITDAAQVVSAVDGVILVVRAGATEREAVEMALERLDRAGARLLGIVLNDVSVPRYHKGYYGARSYVVG